MPPSLLRALSFAFGEPPRARRMLLAGALLLAGGAAATNHLLVQHLLRVGAEANPQGAAGRLAEHAGDALLLSDLALGVLSLLILLAAWWLERRAHLQEQADARLRNDHDRLTTLLSHAGWHDRLEEELLETQAGGGQLGLLVLDFRRFREVNEILGPEGGDAVLRQAADRLREAARRGDLLGRLSGNRFALARRALRDPKDAAALAAQLAAALAAPFEVEGQALRLEADIGLAMAPQDGSRPEQLLRHAEIALRAARSLPDAAIRRFEPEMDAAQRRRRRTARELREALERGQLALQYQPQRRLRDRALIGFEALLRWPHPDRGMIPPAEFIPIAEETGLIQPIGAWVLRTACAEAATWPGEVPVAVNLSPAQFRGGDVVADVRQALTETGLPPHRLELEITESLLSRDTEEMVALLTALRGLGVRIAMDDFGTGWSSLAHLWRFPFGKLKVDRAFVRNLPRDPKLKAINATILALGRTLGLQVLAEGVETEDQARLLLALGCEEAQGWLLGRPLGPAGAAARVTAEVKAARNAA